MIAAELTGGRFGRLAVERRVDSKPVRWLCRCDCGASSIQRTSSLRRGLSRSCGCLSRERSRVVHGLSYTPEYKALDCAYQRCRNHKSQAWNDYGGRGIEYRMPDGFGVATAALIAAIGTRPPGKSLDRIDNDGHYEIGNLRWATASEQTLNQRRARQ